MGFCKKIANGYNRWVWNKTKKLFNKVGSDCKCQENFSIREPQFINMGNDFRGGKNISIHCWKQYKQSENSVDPQLSIGDKVSMTKNSYISCANEVVIGNGVLIGENAFITDNMHGANTLGEIMIPPSERELYSKGRVLIEDNAWIGRNVCIMPNVRIGKGAIIGANAVVTHDIPDYCIAAGVPAKPIKFIKD